MTMQSYEIDKLLGLTNTEPEDIEEEEENWLEYEPTDEELLEIENNNVFLNDIYND